jgi:hypothetical protein
MIMNCKGFRRKRCGLEEVLSRNFNGGTERNNKESNQDIQRPCHSLIGKFPNTSYKCQVEPTFSLSCLLVNRSLENPIYLPLLVMDNTACLCVLTFMALIAEL